MRIAISLLALALASNVHAQATFEGLGDLPPDPFWSEPYGVSPDGLVAVGWSGTADGQVGPGPGCFGSQAFRWTEAGGMQPIEMPGEGDSIAYSASADGAVIVGVFGDEFDLCFLYSPFRWTEAAGLEFLGFQGRAHAVSADGGTIVGYQISNGHAVRWTPEELLDLGTLGAAVGSGNSQATDVTADGSLVVGFGTDPTHNQTPFRWTAATGMLPLGNVQGRATAVSPEGSCIVGRASDGSGRPHQPFLWSEDAGFTWLGYLHGGPVDPPSMWPYDTSTGCGTVVGYAGEFFPNFEAFVWQGRVVRSVKDLLGEQGADTTGWALQIATGVSADGRTIVGIGTNPDGLREGWVAHVPDLDVRVQTLAAIAALLVRRQRRPQ